MRIFLILALLVLPVVASAELVPLSVKWPAYAPCKPADTSCNPDPALYEMRAFCALGTPTDADLVGSEPINNDLDGDASKFEIYFDMTMNEGDTASCYIKAARLADNAQSQPSGVGTFKLPFSMTTPVMDGVNRR